MLTKEVLLPLDSRTAGELSRSGCCRRIPIPCRVSMSAFEVFSIPDEVKNNTTLKKTLEFIGFSRCRESNGNNDKVIAICNVKVSNRNEYEGGK